VSNVVPHEHPQAVRAAADDILELHESGELEAALAACDDLLARPLDLGDEVLRESAFTARFERGAVLAELGDLAGAAAAHLEAAELLPFDLDDPDQAHELGLLLLNAGTCLDAAGDADAALTAYERLDDQLGAAVDPVTSELVVRGRVNRAVTLLATERFDGALAAASELTGQLDGVDPVQAEQLGMAHRIRAAALRALDRSEEAVVALAEAETLAAVADGAVRSQAAAAQGERAELLAELGRVDEAMAVLRATVERFAGDPDVAPVIVDLRRVEAELLEAVGDHERAAAIRAQVSA
jgi:tetratricopeptide (TPR) repeat protein